MSEVTLTWHELEVAAMTGCARQIQAARQGMQEKGRRGRAGAEQNWSEHILGACGEMAFAKARNIYFDHSVDSFKRPDVGAAQVRTRSRPDYELIVQPDANDDDWYVLVLPVRLPCTFRIVGCIKARDAKREEWLKTHGGFQPAYFVPHSALRPLQ